MTRQHVNDPISIPHTTIDQVDDDATIRPTSDGPARPTPERHGRPSDICATFLQRSDTATPPLFPAV